ncbi:MAG: hypothetical protein MI919_41585, partial [Holophagales bacterium]|nr:hypothetical protein [Holophagales bacterium]
RTARPRAKTRLAIVHEVRMRLAYMSVWVDGRRKLTRRLETESLMDRWVGREYHFEIPVEVGRRKVEVHVSGLSTRVEARGSLVIDLVSGRSPTLRVDLDRRKAVLDLSLEEPSP